MLEADVRNVAVDCFADSLADLTVNSKPLINFLTTVAKENLEHAADLVAVVDTHIKKTPTIVKLPILYLIDSIIKNVATKYTEMFSSVIKENFATIYKEADKSMRQSMLKLRQTWDGIFPSEDLCALDIDIYSFDSSWILDGKSLEAFNNKPCKILLNPRFMTVDPAQSEVGKTDDDDAEVLREQLLLQKQKRDLDKEFKKSNLSQADSTTHQNRPQRRHGEDYRKSRRYSYHRAYHSYKHHKTRKDHYKKNRTSNYDHPVVCDKEMQSNIQKDNIEISTYRQTHITLSGTSSTTSELCIKTFETSPCDFQNDIKTTVIEECKQKFIPACHNEIGSTPSCVVLGSSVITEGKFKQPLLPIPSTEPRTALPLDHSHTAHKFFNSNSPLTEKLVEITQERIFDYKHGCVTPKKQSQERTSCMQTGNYEEQFYHSHFNRQEPMWTFSDINSQVKYSVLSLPPACETSLRCLAQDPMGAISVDGVSQEVRYYGHTAVIGARGDNPREILFKPGYASIILNNLFIHCAFHEPNKEIMLMGKCYRLRLGAPLREVYINDEGFQCAFNYPPKEIQLSSGEVFNVGLHCSRGPLVHIGASRRDLVSGSVNLSINGVNISCIFLDAKPQRFDIAGIPHILKFVNCFKTTLINDQIVDLHFGGPALALSVNGEVYYLQLSNLPYGLLLGQFSVQGMGAVEKEQNPVSRKSPTSYYPYPSPARTVRGKGIYKRFKKNVMKNALAQCTLANREQTKLSEASSSQSEESLSTANSSYQPCANINIHALFKNLCDVGILTPKLQTECEEWKANKTDFAEVDFSESSSLKVKQPGLVSVLYSGVQCSSCGERFLPDNGETYRKHLDWHFQINHEIRKPQSRPWFLSSKSWIQYETGANISQEVAFQKMCSEQTPGGNEPTSSVPSHEFPYGTVCDVCRDKFEEYFNEEQDEWHLKDCFCNEGLVYHPACFKDYQMTSDSAVVKRLQLLEDELSKESLQCTSNQEEDVLSTSVTSSTEISSNECLKEVLSDCPNSNVRQINEINCLTDEVENTKLIPPSLKLQRKDSIYETETKLDSIIVKSININENNLTKETDNSIPLCPVLEPTCAVGTEDNLLNTIVPEQTTCGMLKSKLSGRKLTQLPPLVRGCDTSNMCTVN